MLDTLMSFPNRCFVNFHRTFFNISWSWNHPYKLNSKGLLTHNPIAQHSCTFKLNSCKIISVARFALSPSWQSWLYQLRNQSIVTISRPQYHRVTGDYNLLQFIVDHSLDMNSFTPSLHLVASLVRLEYGQSIPIPAQSSMNIHQYHTPMDITIMAT